MRGYRSLLFPAVAAALAAAGCVSARHDTGTTAAATAAATVSVAPQARLRSPAPAPSDPDLGTVLERYYQYIEGGHWGFAYAMLSPRYRATLSRNDLMDRYDDLVEPNVRLRQTTASLVTVWLDGADRTDRSRTLHLEETVTLAWDGEQWRIDDIVRRDVTPSTP